MEENDVLVCFTDGILETTNADGEEYGRKRLIEVARNNRHQGSRDLYQTIMEEVSDFSQNQSLADDQTLVVIRKEGRT